MSASTAPVIIAASKIIDAQGSLEPCLSLEAGIKALGVTPAILTIDPLRAGWHTPRRDGHFRSGCAPIEALQYGVRLLAEGKNQAFVISGDEPLKTGYSREERLQLMAIYEDDYPITRAYDDLAGRFIGNQGITESLFRQCCESLFENYKRTFCAAGSETAVLPDERWYRSVTPRFRGVDCANPVIDFSGRLLIVSPELADALQIPNSMRVAVTGVDVQHLDGDGRDYIGQISDYQHLQTAFTNSCHQAGVDFADLFRRRQALLEVYSCYPVVPMAFMLVSRLIDSLMELPELLRDYAVTVTGGMNLARAPWNSPALNGLISMYQQLISQSEAHLAAVHGNGGLGYRQGVAILEQR